MERQLCLKPVWWSMLSKTIVLGASLVETSPHLDWAASRLNASQHHQSSSHSEQIATIPYSQQIGQFPQNRLNLGLGVLAWRSTWLPYSADLFCSFWSLYVFHNKHSKAISNVNSSLKNKSTINVKNQNSSRIADVEKKPILAVPGLPARAES